MKNRFFALAGAIALIFSLILPSTIFSSFADDLEANLYVYTRYSNSNSVTDQVWGNQTLYPCSEMSTCSVGDQARIDGFLIRSSMITSSKLFIRVDFSLIYNGSAYSANPTIDDGFPVSVGGTVGGVKNVTVSDDNYSASCFAYLTGQYVGDMGEFWLPGVNEDVLFRGNKQVSILLEVTTPIYSEQSSFVKVMLDSPIIMYHTLNREDTLFLVPTRISTYTDASMALFAYLADIRNNTAYLDDIAEDVNQDAFNTSGIWTWLVNHADEFENLNDIPDILEALTLLTGNRIWRYRYLSSNYQQIIQSGLVPWYDALFHNLENISSRFLLLGQKNFTHWQYTDNGDGTITKTEQTSSWYTALLTSVKNLDYMIEYYTKDRILEQEAEDAGLAEFAQEGFDKAGDNIDDMSGFLDITDMGTFNPSAMGAAGEQSFLDWFSQHNAEMIDNVPQSRRPLSDNFIDYLTPHMEEIDEYLNME